MSDIRNVSDLFKVPKKTADILKDQLKELEAIKSMAAQLKAVGVVDDKFLKTMDDLGDVAKSILKNFPIDESTT